jgi:hypothetical protein
LRVAFERTLVGGSAQGLGQGQRLLRVALDTSWILGQGTVLDTYNLISADIRRLVLGLARAERQPQLWCAQAKRLELDVGSFSGGSEVDRARPESREQFLGNLVADARRVLELGGEA